MRTAELVTKVMHCEMECVRPTKISVRVVE